MTGGITTFNTMASTLLISLRLSMGMLLLHHRQVLLPGLQPLHLSLLSCRHLPSRPHQHPQPLPITQRLSGLLLSSILGKPLVKQGTCRAVRLGNP